MNTIHSSSLAFYRVGYINPEQDRFEKNQTKRVEANSESAKNLQSIERPVSTPEQIKTAIESTTLRKDNYDLPGNSRAAKALLAYTETRNQPMQTQLAASLSSVDFYV